MDTVEIGFKDILFSLYPFFAVCEGPSTGMWRCPCHNVLVLMCQQQAVAILRTRTTYMVEHGIFFQECLKDLLISFALVKGLPEVLRNVHLQANCTRVDMKPRMSHRWDGPVQLLASDIGMAWTWALKVCHVPGTACLLQDACVHVLATSMRRQYDPQLVMKWCVTSRDTL